MAKTRRQLLSRFAWLGALGSLRPNNVYASYLAARHGEIYRQLGVRPLINAAGTYTTLTGSVMTPRAIKALAEAAQCFVPLIELQKAVGERIARLLDVPAALVTSGAASSIQLATAACIAGMD